jgi:hypothetical protein
VLHQSGTPFIFFLTYPLTKFLGLSFLTCSFIFSLFGFTGFIFFYLTIKRSLKGNVVLFGRNLLPYILFLPNMHFWSAGIGKDTIMFFALTMFIFSLTNPLKNLVLIGFAFYLAYFIRPHIALLMIVGLGFSMVTSSKGISLFWRAGLLAVSVYAFVVISPSVLEFIGLENESVEEIENVAAIKSKYLSRSQGSSISISTYSTPVKILTFLYRPLFFDFVNLFGLIVSFENLFYVLLTLSIFRWSTIYEIITLPTHLKAALMVLGSASFFLSSSLGNLGIVIRQKNMVMFMFLLIIMYLMEKVQQRDQIKWPSRRAVYGKTKTA